MEITPKIKSKVFAQYLGQNITTSIKGFELAQKLLSISIENEDVRINRVPYNEYYQEGFHINSCKLLLRPLSAITDEDAIEVAKILEPRHNKYTIERRDNMVVVWFSHWCIQVHFDGRIRQSQAIMWLNSNNVFQYLQSKGYDLPSIHLSGKTLHEAGLAKHINEI